MVKYMFYAERVPGYLKESFYEKCYICEIMIAPGDYNTEHRIPQSANIGDDRLQQELNLFSSCGRCNGKKSDKFYVLSNECECLKGYVGIVDCTKCDPNQYIKLKFSQDFAEYKITVDVKKRAPCVNNTVDLLKNIYCSSEKMADNSLSNLQSQVGNQINILTTLIGRLRCAVKNREAIRTIERYKRRTIECLRPDSPFSAFKKSFIEELYEISLDEEIKNVLGEILNDPRVSPNVQDICSAK